MFFFLDKIFQINLTEMKEKKSFCRTKILGLGKRTKFGANDRSLFLSFRSSSKLKADFFLGSGFINMMGSGGCEGDPIIFAWAGVGRVRMINQ